MNCQKRNLYLFVFSLFVSLSFAQSDFRPGYILLSPEDTVFGELDNKSYHENSQYINFRLSKTDNVERFGPLDLFAYRFQGGKYYISKLLKVDNLEQQIFMEYLINGSMDIYLFQDKDAENRYYVSNDTLPMREIKYTEKFIQVDGRRYLHKYKGYEPILRYYTMDCPEIHDEISNIEEPDRDKLIKFAKKYHEATCEDGTCIIYEKKAPKRILLKTGMAVMQFLPSVEKEYSNDGIGSEIMYDYGVDVLFQVTDGGERTYLGIGLHQVHFIEELELGYGELGLPLSINYSLSKNGFSPVASYSVYLVPIGLQKIDVGIQYRYKNVSLSINAGAWTWMVYKPVACLGQINVSFDLR